MHPRRIPLLLGFPPCPSMVSVNPDAGNGIVPVTKKVIESPWMGPSFSMKKVLVMEKNNNK